MKPLVVLTLCIAAACGKPRAVEDKYKLPAGFLFGAGTSAYQTEGAWNEDGKGEGVLDHAYHSLNTPSNQTGDVASDSYHRYKEDIRLAEELGLNVLRISLSWPRLFPDGKVSNPNAKGIQHYHDVFAEMTARKIQPMVTLFHFDYPQGVQDEVGGWLGDKMPDKFAEFADFVFKEYGDKVKYWITVNEAVFYCQFLVEFLPSPVNSVPRLTAEKKDICVKNVLLGHAKAHKVYEEKYSSTQKGMVGFGAGPQFFRGATDSQDDIDAAEVANVQTGLGLSLDPFIFGDYPEGNYPRLAFTNEEKKLIKGRLDFVGINVYTGLNVSATSSKTVAGDNHPDGFGGVEGAWVLRALPIWIKKRYDKVKKLPIFITENGLNADGSPSALDDWDSRAVYFSAFLREMCAGINEDGTRIIGYAAWSLIDTFEFINGFSNWGMIHVDFANGTLDRTLKASSTFFKTVARTGYVPLVEAGSQPFPDPDAPTSAPSASQAAATSIPAVLAALLALIYIK